VKRAFTMIELIFAIIVIGIVAISIPLALTTTQRGVEQNIQQEAIVIASTAMNQILSYPWDEYSRDPGSTTLAKTEALSVTSGDSELNKMSTNPDFRHGHFQESKRRRMSPANNERFASTGLGSDSSDRDDIDDFISTDAALNSVSDATSYKSAYTADVSASYVSDAANYSQTDITFNFGLTGTGTTNLKMIVVDVKQDNTMIIRMRAYASNIGETDYYSKEY
jgi:prepilin-type N-terminal cleavage/methylation domain-containing protein